jgi:hypothetical protein
MVNRGNLWATEADLEADLPALFGNPRRPAVDAGLRTALGTGELMIGRFFFVHRARARRDEDTMQTYEFLHATFGEYLVARLTWQVLREMVAREAASTMSLVDDDLLRALLSFTPLSYSTAVIRFIREMAFHTNTDRELLGTLLVRLYREAGASAGQSRFAGYRPQPINEIARFAAYSANLLLLAVCVNGRIQAGALYAGSPDVIAAWRSQALLWESQLTASGWSSLVDVLHVDRMRGQDQRDLLFYYSNIPRVWPPGDNGSWADSPSWTHYAHADRVDADGSFHDESYIHWMQLGLFQCSPIAETFEHTLSPFLLMREVVGLYVNGEGDSTASAINQLLSLWLMPFEGDRGERDLEAAYLRCIDNATHLDRLGLARSVYLALTIDRLATDPFATPAVAAGVIRRVASIDSEPDIEAHVRRCWGFFSGQDAAADEVAETALRLLQARWHSDRYL